MKKKKKVQTFDKAGVLVATDDDRTLEEAKLDALQELERLLVEGMHATDGYAIKAAEGGAAIPPGIKVARNGLRSTKKTLELEVLAASDLDELDAVLWGERIRDALYDLESATYKHSAKKCYPAGEVPELPKYWEGELLPQSLPAPAPDQGRG